MYYMYPGHFFLQKGIFSYKLSIVHVTYSEFSSELNMNRIFWVQKVICAKSMYLLRQLAWQDMYIEMYIFCTIAGFTNFWPKNMCQFCSQDNQFENYSAIRIILTIGKSFAILCSQRFRIDLNKMPLLRPKTTTAWKLIPHRSNISKNWNPPWWELFCWVKWVWM